MKTNGWDDASQVKWLADDEGIAFVPGKGRLAGERRVEVTTFDGDTRTLRSGAPGALARRALAPLAPHGQ